MEERQTLCNMAIEAGGKNGIIAPDAITSEYVDSRTSKPYEKFSTDSKASFYADRTYNLADLEPVRPVPATQPPNESTLSHLFFFCFPSSC